MTRPCIRRHHEPQLMEMVKSLVTPTLPPSWDIYREATGQSCIPRYQLHQEVLWTSNQYVHLQFTSHALNKYMGIHRNLPTPCTQAFAHPLTAYATREMRSGPGLGGTAVWGDGRNSAEEKKKSRNSVIPRNDGIPSKSLPRKLSAEKFRGNIPRKSSAEFFRGTSAAELFRETRPRNFSAEFFRGKPKPSPTTGLKKWPW